MLYSRILISYLFYEPGSWEQKKLLTYFAFKRERNLELESKEAGVAFC